MRAGPTGVLGGSGRWSGNRVLIGLWVLAALVTAIATARALSLHIQSDLRVYVEGARTLVSDSSLYAFTSRSGDFIYPPFAGLAFLPLAFVAADVSRVAWTALTIGAVYACGYIIARTAGKDITSRRLLWPAGVTVLLLSRPVQSNLRLGQVSALLAVAILCDLFILDRHPKQGVVTGACAAIKLTPLIFIPYLWLIGRKRAAAMALAAFAIATGIGLALLPQDSLQFWGHEVWQNTQIPILHYLRNQSLMATLLRAGADLPAVRILWLAGAILVTSLAFPRARAAWKAGQPTLGVAIIGCAAILVSPISWTHHRIWMLLAATGTFALTVRVNWAVRALILGVMLVRIPGLDLPSPLSWTIAHRDVVLAVAIACLLPVKQAVASDRAVRAG